MPWINDVVPNEAISSSQYGNAIRDKVIHQFDSVAQRNAQAVPQRGMHCWCIAEATEYRHDGTGWVILDEPWQTQTNPKLQGANATANGPDWTLDGQFQQHYKLDPAKTICRFKRSRDTCLFQGAYGVLAGPAPGTPEQILYAVLPVACFIPAYVFGGSGGGYSSGGGGDTAWGQMGGPLYLGGNICFAIRSGSGATVNIRAGGGTGNSTYYPSPNDSFYVATTPYQTAVNYG